ncbi:hypothetical protein JYU34_010415 [Plutella xylostella]|uniref:Uncharacterized protein n=1 Tax=Plutella xylostella TaxID=51655 RepID=A0ABQ7QIE4_PLUXY|nr:hypothetical protein JYU34_010415 [Plutella xylostella]
MEFIFHVKLRKAQMKKHCMCTRASRRPWSWCVGTSWLGSRCSRTTRTPSPSHCEEPTWRTMTGMRTP